ncbi:unnamed protein product, partial [Prorocentrum cordatum]
AGPRPLLLGVDGRGRVSLWDAQGSAPAPVAGLAPPLWQLDLDPARGTEAGSPALVKAATGLAARGGVPWEGARALSWAPSGQCFAAVGRQASKAVYLWRVYDAGDRCAVTGLYCGRGGAGARGAAEQDGVCSAGPPDEGIVCPWPARAVSFCAGGHCLAVAEDIRLRPPPGQQPELAVFDVETRLERHRVAVTEEVWGLAYMPQSRRLVVSTTARVMLWPVGRPRGEASDAGLRCAVGSRLWPRWGAQGATSDEPWEVDVEYREEFQVRAWEDVELDSELLVTSVLPVGPAAWHGVEAGKRWLLKGYRESVAGSGLGAGERQGRLLKFDLGGGASPANLLRKLGAPISLVFQRPLGDDVIAEAAGAQGHQVHCTAVSPDGTRLAVATASRATVKGASDAFGETCMEIAIWSVEGPVPWRVEKVFLRDLKDGCLLKRNGSLWALAWADVDTLLVSSEAAGAGSLTAISVASGEVEQQWALQPGTHVRAMASVPPSEPAGRQVRMAIAMEQPGGARIELSTGWVGAPGEALVHTNFSTAHKGTLELLAACTPCGGSVALAGRSQLRQRDDSTELTDGEVRVLRFTALGAVTQRSVWSGGTAFEDTARRRLKHIALDGPVLALLFDAGGGTQDLDAESSSAVEVFLEESPGWSLLHRWEGIPGRLDAAAVHYWPAVAGKNARSAEAALAVGVREKDQCRVRMVRLSLQGKGQAWKDWSSWEDLQLQVPSPSAPPADGHGGWGAVDLRFSPDRTVQERDGSVRFHSLLAGRLCAHGSRQFTVQVWDVESRRSSVAAALSPLEGPASDEIWCVDACWVPQAKLPRRRVAYAMKGGLYAVDLQERRRSSLFRFLAQNGEPAAEKEKVTALRFSPCGSVLAVGSKTGMLAVGGGVLAVVRLYMLTELASGACFRQACPDLDLGEGADVRGLASPGVLRAAVGEADAQLLMPSRVVCFRRHSVVVDDLRSLSSRVYAMRAGPLLTRAGGGVAAREGDFSQWLRASPSLVHQRLLRRHLSWTLLHVYAHFGLAAQVQEILDIGAPFLALDARGRSALDVALDLQHFKVVDTILKHVLRKDQSAVRGALPSEHLALSSTVVRLLESHRMIDDRMLIEFLEKCCCQEPLTPLGSHGSVPDSAPLFHEENICSFPAPLFVPGDAQMDRLLSEDANSRWSLPGRLARPRPVEVKVWYLRGLDRQAGLTRALAHTRKSPEILRAGFATTVLKHKWASFAKGRFQSEIRQYLLILIFFIVFCESGKGLCSDLPCSQDTLVDLVLLGCTVGMLVLCVLSIYSECVEIGKEAALWRKDHGRLTALSVPSILRLAILNIWNVFDFARIFLTLLCVICSILARRSLFDTLSGRTLLAFTAIVSWSRMLSFFRGFSYTSDLVLTVVRIIKEVLVVLSLLSVVLLAFTHAMYIFFNLNGAEGFRLALEYVYIGGIIGDPPDQPESFSNCVDTANGADGLHNPHTDAPMDCEWFSEHPSWCDRAALEYYDDSDFTVTDMCCDCGGGLEGNQFIPLALYMLLSVVMLVILMNFIIAFMGDSFNRAREDLDAAKNEMRAELVYEYEGDLTEDDALASSYIFIQSRG